MSKIARSESVGDDLCVGDRVGAYLLVRPLGDAAGVWRGTDQRRRLPVLLRRVAASGDHARQAQDRCQRAMVALIDKGAMPRVGRWLDVVTCRRSGVWVVGEHVTGRPLEQLIAARRAPMVEPLVLGILTSAAAALRQVHQRGLVCGQLFPGELWLAAGGGIRLSGLALVSGLVQSEGVTGRHAAYLSPEAISGQTLDARADIYSLGMIAYRMLAGPAAFERAFALVLRDTQSPALRWARWHGNARLSAPPLTKLAPGISPALSDLVARMMIKDPAARLDSVDTLIAVVKRHFVRGQPTDIEPIIAAATAPATPASADAGRTAPLPGRRRGRGVATIAMIAAATVLVTATAWWLGRPSGPPQPGRAVLLQARRQYANGQFTQARVSFGKLAEAWPAASPLGKQARAGQLQTQAQLALAHHAWSKAQAVMGQLMGRGSISPSVKQLAEEVSHRAGFAHSMAAVEAALKRGEIQKAQQMLTRWSNLILASSERARWRVLELRLARRVRAARVDATLTQARRLAGQGKLAQALAALKQGEMDNTSPRLTAAMSELRHQQRLAAAIAAGDAAVGKRRWAAAGRAYRQAFKAGGSAKVAARLRRVQGKAALSEGKRLLAAGHPLQAEVALALAVSFDGDQTAKRLLARIEQTGRAQRLTRAGEAAAAGGLWDQAIGILQAAIAAGAGKTAKAQLQQARVGRLLATGKQAIAAGRLAQASRALDAAQTLAPGSVAVAQARAALKQRQAYAQALAAGDALEKRGDYDAAKNAYRRARAVIDTPAVDRRLTAVSYEALIVRARSEIAAGRWAQAEALLRSAAGLDHSVEITSLLAKVRAAMAKEGSGDDN